ncbi:hypothetical protein V490_07564 [Pseudogymnoascus sp. VKM F-3557]|nr:hypothetical protein V490_07564 [Pseudogymnoascus sp. VKM F-3557]
MLANKDTAIRMTSLLMVPYEAHHETRRRCCSSLSLSEEYSLQANLPNEKDRLTFIVCLPIPTENSAQDADVRAGQDDKPDLIASKLHQDQGYERIILMALVSYVGSVEGDISEEIMPGYDKDDDTEDFREIEMLFGAKLKEENMDRRGEYETMGFKQIYEKITLAKQRSESSGDMSDLRKMKIVTMWVTSTHYTFYGYSQPRLLRDALVTPKPSLSLRKIQPMLGVAQRHNAPLAEPTLLQQHA